MCGVLMKRLIYKFNLPILLYLFSVVVKIKTNKQQIQELLFLFQTLYMLTCSTIVKFAYYTYVIIERHLNITTTP